MQTHATAKDFDNDFLQWLPQLKRLASGTNAGQGGTLAENDLIAVSRTLKELSHGFTRERGLAGRRYFSEARFRAAYLLYFWPISYLEARLVFEHLLWPGLLQGAAVLDLGSGPAPAAFAALDRGASRAVAADSNRDATALALRLAQARNKKLIPAYWDGLKPGGLPPGSFRIIILSHLLNELWPEHTKRVQLRAERVADLAGSLDRDGVIVIIEPALLMTTRDLLALRDLLVKKGFPVLSPCVRQRACPCLEEEGATCHANFPWNPPPYLTKLAHRARIGKETLPFSCLVLGKPGRIVPQFHDARTFRVVSDKMIAKSNRIRYFICGKEGRFTLSATGRGEEKWRALFNGLRRYDAIVIAGTEKRAHGEGLLEESILKKVSVWDF